MQTIRIKVLFKPADVTATDEKRIEKALEKPE
jgi:hypothetical protein